jgi:hypothetical protein
MVNACLQWRCWHEEWEENLTVEILEQEWYVVETIAHLKTLQYIK